MEKRSHKNFLVLVVV